MRHVSFLLPLLIFLAACSCTTHRDARNLLYVDTYEPTVLVHCYCDTGGSRGTGTVISSHSGITYILTAAHVVVDEMLFSDSFEIEVTDWNGNNPHSFKASLVLIDTKIDLALLRAEYSTSHIARLSAEGPVLFEEVRLTGIGLGNIPLPVKGEFQGNSLRGLFICSAPAYPGYSGGALYKYDWESEHWVMVGVVLEIGVTGRGQFVYHVSYHQPISVVLEWLESSEYTGILK